MKKISICTLAALALALVLLTPTALPQAPTAGSWNGWITDSHCGAKGAKADHKDCAEKCVKGGSSLLLFNTTDKKLYKLDKQDVAQQHLGHEVTIKGKVSGDKITVDSIAPKER